MSCGRPWTIKGYAKPGSAWQPVDAAEECCRPEKRPSLDTEKRVAQAVASVGTER